MPDLIAQGPQSENRWRRELPSASSGVQILIGRSGADWNVPWDKQISKSHVRLSAESGDRVDVSCLATARNPVFHRGNKVLCCTLVPGDHFVIGKTTFTLANRPGVSDLPQGGEVTEHLYDHAALRRGSFRDTASRIELLGRLPDLITRSGSDEELLVRVTSVLLQATPSASAVAIAAVDQESAEGRDGEIQILHYDSRVLDMHETRNEDPPVSARLVQSAVRRRENVLHLWSGHGGHDASLFTAAEGFDWAFCVPLRSESCPGWAIYVTGQLSGEPGAGLEKSIQDAPDELQDDVKFAEIVGTTISNLRQSLRLERRQAAMRRFFAPVVMEALAGRDTDQVLSPREADLSVMFCDLRGFSRRSEQDSNQLLQLLERVSDTLGVMTGHILDTGGVIGDFHGDAAMGFWGWPLDQSDIAIRAAEAASRILLTNHSGSQSDRFRCGIGIATGRAVAGRIGTVDQVKVTAFGPVVNLASRLEGMTKAFGAEVIVDQTTAAAIRAANHPFRIRRLAKVRPAGMNSSVEASELLTRSDDHANRLTDQQIAQYETAAEAMIEGNWNQAYDQLTNLPSWDRPSQVLLDTIKHHNRVPPEGWAGVIDVPKF
jgi:adenylate cyclase